MSRTRAVLFCSVLLAFASLVDAGEEGPPLPLDVVTRGSLAPAAHVTFRLPVAPDLLYRLQVEGGEGLGATVLDRARARILRDGSVSPQSTVPLRLLVRGSDGAQWLQLAASGDETTVYRLSWSVYRPGPDDHGDGPRLASGLRWEAPLGGRLERPADEDWFGFDLAPAEEVQVELRAAPGGGPLRLERLDGSGERLRDAVTVEPGEARRIFACSLRGGVQRLRVSGDSDDVDHRYTLTWGPARDDHGDLPTEASPLIVGERVEGDLETFSDTDVFQVELRAGRTYRVVYGGVFSVELRDPSGRRRHRGYYGLVRAFTPRLSGAWTIVVPPDYPGHYSLRVLEVALEDR